MADQEKKKWFSVILGENFFSLLVTAGFLIFGSAYLLYFRSEIKKLAPGGEFDAARHERALAKDGENLQKLKNSISVINSINKTDRERIDRFLPPAPDEPSLLTSLAAITRDSGMTLLTIDTSSGFEQKGNRIKGLKTVEVSLGIGGGDYAGIKIFLDMIERNLRLLDIESFAFTPLSSAYSIRLRAYYLE